MSIHRRDGQVSPFPGRRRAVLREAVAFRFLPPPHRDGLHLLRDLRYLLVQVGKKLLTALDFSHHHIAKVWSIFYSFTHSTGPLTHSEYLKYILNLQKQVKVVYGINIIQNFFRLRTFRCLQGWLLGEKTIIEKLGKRKGCILHQKRVKLNRLNASFGGII